MQHFDVTVRKTQQRLIRRSKQSSSEVKPDSLQHSYKTARITAVLATHTFTYNHEILIITTGLIWGHESIFTHREIAKCMTGAMLFVCNKGVKCCTLF